jgi:hypothetical protein
LVEYATAEGVVAKIFSSKNGNTFLNIKAAYPNQTFTGWIPNSSALNRLTTVIAAKGIGTGSLESEVKALDGCN